jgi:hypothetical protein
MAAIALIAVSVLALLVAFLFAALVEMFRDVRQMRDAVGILDRPLPVELGDVAGTTPSAYGLPRALDNAASAIVLFLSERCGTCHTLASALPRSLPPELWVVVEGRTVESTSSFLERYALSASSDGQVVADPEGEIARRIGLQTTPLGFRVDGGVFTYATSVPSSRYLNSIMPEPIRLKRAV